MADMANVLVVGEGPVAAALAPMISAAGWQARSATSLDQVEGALGDADAVVVVSHHEGLDGPAIKAALDKGTPYVGAMGSRKTQARRHEWLLGNGVDEDRLASVRAPIGLDIGADEPGEIAVSILAEIVAVRRGAGETVGSVSDRTGPIHPDLEPGTATCPGG
jgi:xanthine/CO dehydrogenase XdhC/CoxF family maturation factor